VGRDTSHVRLSWLAVICLLPSLAGAAEPRTAIAAIAVPPSVAPELNRAFQEALTQWLSAAGFSLKPPAEVDMQMGERPEFVNCRAGGCLAEEASFLRVQRLILPRLEPASDGFVVGLSAYDAGHKKVIADAIDRCAPCSADGLRAMVATLAKKLHAELAQPGTLEVTSQPPGPLTVDGKVVGVTPWSGTLEPGDHVIAMASPAGRVERDVAVEPGKTARVNLLVPVAAAPPPRRGQLGILKWVALGVGVAGVAAGAGLLAVDGHGTCGLAAGQKQCPKVYDTLPAGAALVSIGGALLVTSVILIVIDRPARKFALGVEPLSGGAALSAWGKF